MGNQTPFQITRTDPDVKILQKRMKKEKDGDLIRRLQAIIIMLLYDDMKMVLKILDISKDTLKRWIQDFNEEGIEGLAKKNDPEGPRFSLFRNKLR
jgi:predicted transcriptional regulator YheO